MRRPRPVDFLLLATFVTACSKGEPPRPPAPPPVTGTPPVSVSLPTPRDTGSLFLADGDIARVQQILPGLADASRRGKRDAAAYLATLDVPLDRVTQLLSNISVAYSAIKFDEWMRELRPILDTSKASPYRERIAQSERELAQITERYRGVKQGGRTALDVNEEIVRRNLADVEALMVQLQAIDPSVLPIRQ